MMIRLAILPKVLPKQILIHEEQEIIEDLVVIQMTEKLLCLCITQSIDMQL